MLANIRLAAENKTLVYVMPSTSLLDHLLLNTLAIQRKLPISCFANDLPFSLWRTPSSVTTNFTEKLKARLKNPSLRARDECRHITSELEKGNAVTLFLKHPGLFSKPTRWNVMIWEELIRAERKRKCEVVILPLTFMWGRKPSRVRRSLFDILFGERNAPGTIRKTLVFLRHFRNAQIKLGRPVDLSESLSKLSSTKDEVVAKKLRRLLSSYLFRERKLLVGPPTRDRRRIIQTLLKDADLKKLVSGLARREKKPEIEIWRRAESALHELISDHSPTVVAISYRLYRWIWNRLFTPPIVDMDELRKVQNVIKDYPVVLIPSHKSHMDYLLLSGLFYENGMVTPHIAAGINLSFWPMGSLFRKNGAFFIRRTISGDLLYARMLALYTRWLLRTGYPQEFFIEGGRSRTGKLIAPKHGLLSMQVEAYLNGASRDLYIVPICITYEKVPEEASYRNELAGRKKQKETAWALWKSRKLLSRSHGNVHVRFADPISLKKYFDVQPESRSLFERSKSENPHLGR